MVVASAVAGPRACLGICKCPQSICHIFGRTWHQHRCCNHHVTGRARCHCASWSLKKEELAAGLELAYEKADELLRGTLTTMGLAVTKLQRFTVHTRKPSAPKEDGPPNIYWPMNRALRMLQFDVVRAFWLYIMLLQSALLKIPPAKDALYRGLRNPQPPICSLTSMFRLLIVLPTCGGRSRARPLMNQ